MSRKERKEPPAAAAAEEEARPSRPARLTPVEIQQKEFRLSVRGYNEHEVDEFLDQVTEEVARLTAEVKRAQEDLEYRRTVPLETDAAVEAEAILERARDEAARILADADRMAAEIRAGAIPAAAGGAAVAAAATTGPDPVIDRFLTREREFLQGLASLIQQHAEAVKEDARGHRAAVEAATAAAAADTPFRSEPDAEPTAEPDEAPQATLDLSDEQEPPEDDASAPTASAGEPTAARDVHDRSSTVDVADLSPVSEGRAPRVEVPEPDEDAGQDRSIRELFWGED
jgi:cell division initiation protein